MRVPDEITKCVVFLCLRKEENGQIDHPYKGTGFWVGVPSETGPGHHLYLVTAKHVVTGATGCGNLHVRVNQHPVSPECDTLGGNVEYIPIESDWTFSEGSIDIAVIPFRLPADRFDFKFLSLSMFLTDETIRDNQIGIGDDLIVTGLFSRRPGLERNLPIVRGGILAAMDTEEMYDEGKPYDAYLAEVRSIGGLSGSPVFVNLSSGRTLDGTTQVNHGGFFLLGLVRGSWRLMSYGGGISRDEFDALNYGITIVTPARQLRDVLFGESLMKERAAADQLRLRQSSSIV